MTEPHKELTLEDRVKDLERSRDGLAQQLQHAQRCLYLIVSGVLQGRLPIPPEQVKNTLQEMAVPCGFFVKMNEGPKAGASKIVTANGHVPRMPNN